MPSTSTLTSSEKAAIKKYAPVASSNDKILTAAIGRIYYAYPDPAKWSYSGISGAIVFGWGSNGGWLKMVDLAVSFFFLCRCCFLRFIVFFFFEETITDFFILYILLNFIGN